MYKYYIKIYNKANELITFTQTNNYLVAYCVYKYMHLYSEGYIVFEKLIDNKLVRVKGKKKII